MWHFPERLFAGRFRAATLVFFIGALCLFSACAVNPNAFPTNAPRPKPVTGTFHGCPAQGSSGDPQLNTLENRVDDDPGPDGYNPITLDTLTTLPNPDNEQGKLRGTWLKPDAQSVAKYEGVAVQTSGYVVAIHYIGPEPVNCNSTTYANYHLWISDNASDPPVLGMVVVLTPRIAVNRPGWTEQSIKNLVGHFIRVSGWLMFNNQPAPQLNEERATLWEVHPVMHLDVDVQSKWVSVDQTPFQSS